MTDVRSKINFIGFVKGLEDISTTKDGVAIQTHTQNCLNRPQDQNVKTETVTLTCNSRVTGNEGGLLTIREFDRPVAVFGLISSLEGTKHYDVLVPLARKIESAIPR